MIISLFSIGLISILGQVVLLRELNVSFYGVELIYLLALGVWLFWTAIGALVGRRTDFPSDKALALLFIIFGIPLPLDIVFIRASRILFGGVPGAYLSFLQQFTIAVISLMPAGILSGILFQWAAKIYVSQGRTVAIAYAIESLGGLVGGLAATVFLIWGIQNLSIAFACAFASVITPLVFLRPKRTSPLLWTAAVLAGILLLLTWKASPIDHLMVAWNHPNLLASKDSPYGRITVAQSYGQISVFENDALAFDTEGTEAEYFTHLAALQHANPEQVLILGGGIEGIVGEMQKYKPKRIDYVELNPVMLDLVMRHLPDDIQKSLSGTECPYYPCRSPPFSQGQRQIRSHTGRHAGTNLRTGKPFLYEGVFRTVRSKTKSRRHSRLPAPLGRKPLDTAVDAAHGEHLPRPRDCFS